MLLIYLAGINAITFAAFGIDKAKAIKNQWRIPEKTLLGLAFAGGSVGALLGMYLFRHKTRKARFVAGVPLMMILQAFGIFLWKTH